ncbi:MAG: RsmB/NOP family class I SAM-dependent RNA methyltransferase [Promethearchaeota archaeon]
MNSKDTINSIDKMQKIDKNTIKIILNLLAQFLEGKIDRFFENYRANLKVIHYYNEIIRYWNKINFVIRKTLRVLKEYDKFDKQYISNKENWTYWMTIYLYATYRVILESNSIDLLIKELNSFINMPNDKIKFSQFLIKLRTFNWERAFQGKSHIERLSLEEAIPTFVIQHLLPVMSFEFLKKNLHFMNNLIQHTDCTIRINTLQANLIPNIKQTLEKSGILIQEDSEIPELFHIPIKKRPILLQTELYKSGYLIFQDKASVIVGNLLDPQPGEFVCDMCAAPGLKTSLIAQSADNSTVIIAVDVHTHRVYQMKYLLKQLNVLNAQLINADSYTLPIKSNIQFDRVLLDAPCTGTGTFLTNPVLKWRQNKSFLEQNCHFQFKLLEAALHILKPRGILVYSTCSLYPEEGELQILRHLDMLKPLKLPDWLSPSYKIDNNVIAGTGRLFPAVHHIKGFFIAKFEKKT